MPSAIVAVILAANVALASAAGASIAVPVGLAAAALALVVGRRTGLSWAQLGLDRRRLRDGLLVGGIGALVPITVAVLVLMVPAMHDALGAGSAPVPTTPAGIAYELAVRIPIGTVLVEELLFRSALLGALSRRHAAAGAVGWSATTFGAWHVLPALVQRGDPGAFGAIANTVGDAFGLVVIVVATTLAGAVFAWLRLRGGHVAASVVVHAAVNTTAYAVVLLAS